MDQVGHQDCFEKAIEEHRALHALVNVLIQLALMEDVKTGKSVDQKAIDTTVD